jgi:hypothetical protein
MLVTPALIKQFGWKVGDRLTSARELKTDGSLDWEFEIVGTFAALRDRLLLHSQVFVARKTPM